jgi:TM2 domain-containing membrane protein YozV
MRQGDYFRAISEYKRTAFHSEDDSIRSYCLLQIAKSYRKSFRYESAIQYSTELLSAKNVPHSLRQQCNLNLGLVYVDSHMPQLSIPYFKELLATDSTGFALSCMGLAELEMQDFGQASLLFKEAAKTTKDPTYRQQTLRLSGETESFVNRPQKSPLLASTLSFILPGSGQIYAGHIYDGVQAFLFTAASAFATYAIWKYEHSFKDRLELTYIGISITALFHAANVIGAHQTANFHNWKQHDDFVRDVHHALSAFEP